MKLVHPLTGRVVDVTSDVYKWEAAGWKLETPAETEKQETEKPAPQTSGASRKKEEK
ncbi:MAG: hypothetical protein FWG47_05000 [Propionibacteriaceae bacterium]|nr:hypothetical protein [Propionibacteriaceae bacterium]